MFLFMAENIIDKLLKPSVRGRIWQIFALIIVLVLIAGFIDFGAEYNKGVDWLANKTGQTVVLPKSIEIPFRLGLDLQGGTHLVYKADMSKVDNADRASAIEGVRDVIERRVNVFGVSEPNIQTSLTGGEYRVIVELAGVSDVNEAIKMIGETPLLEFKEQSNEPPALTEEQKAEINDYNKKAEQKGADILGKLISGGDFAALAKDMSEDDASKINGGDLGWITETDKPEIVGAAKKLKVGDTSKDLVKLSDGYNILKLAGKRQKTNPFNEQETEKEVKAAHILVCFKDAKDCTTDLEKDKAKEIIDNLKKEATPQNFKDLAKKNSTEPGAEESGGELGWFTRDMMVKPFSDAVYGLKKGQISDVVETEFGYHLIYKEDERTIDEYQISRILIKTKSESDYIDQGEQNWKNTELTGKYLARATVSFNPNDNMPEVALEFDDEGAKHFEDITGRNVGKPVAIFLDGYAISVPTVNEKITGGKAVISGKFNIQEAKLLAQRLTAGALPVPITLISQQTVGPTLGKSSLDSSLRAGIAALLLVGVFMIMYYRLPGLMSVVALVIYGILVLSVFKIFKVTLTLPGIAGFIMSVGMAVDANVLIFARLREELARGRHFALAMQEGFKRAWPSIRDSNISTMITCLILIQFSTSIVKGFAVTLLIGVVISLITAIIITRNFMQLIAGDWIEKKIWLISSRKKDTINF